ncbi:hypothetical protein AC579_2611 [Pseudocercospora musae]|uniref:Methyltransferase domain-containing protein n=1 Tax=Pseudocercospora musae TaxID=113226 RepID=A0A139HUT1_9PEZI|nr:hypothetical protein AC579_2611 [Pseudocercospora musae]
MADDNIEADRWSDQDSAFGGTASLADSTTSITSSIRDSVFNYQFEHGRRYHAFQAGKYIFPNDEQEMERMDIEHHNQKLQMNGHLFLCPLVDEPTDILDLGTGTGIWCIDMADKYPDCQLIGTDLSPVQPSWTPPNCRFEIDDFDKEWTFGSDRFDMIRHAFIVGHVKDYPEFYKRAFNALKPGGSMQIVEIEFQLYCDDGTLAPDSALLKWCSLMYEAFAKIRAVVPTAENYKEWLEDAGYENVHLEIIKRPSNDWPKDPKWKEIGRYCCLNFLEGMEGFTVGPLTRVLGWKPEEVQVLLAQMRSEWLKRKIHAYHKGIVCYGTKPMQPTTGTNGPHW